MKTVFYVFCSLLIFSSCAVNNTNKVKPENALSFKLDGQEYAPTPIADIQNISDIPFIRIYGEFGNNEALFITVREDVAVGAHSIDISNELGVTQSQARYFFNPTSSDISDSRDAKEGTLIISENDINQRRLTGTFSFDTFPKEEGGTIYKFTEGKFDVSY